ncbi:MAG TPA: hypothetical protein V6D09_12525 [Leptolyngbyaceae cyanobacterium]
MTFSARLSYAPAKLKNKDARLREYLGPDEANLLLAASKTGRHSKRDHTYAMVDTATGFVVSAKNPRRWGKMFDCRAALIESPH